MDTTESKSEVNEYDEGYQEWMQEQERMEQAKRAAEREASISDWESFAKRCMSTAATEAYA